MAVGTYSINPAGRTMLNAWTDAHERARQLGVTVPATDDVPAFADWIVANDLHREHGVPLNRDNVAVLLAVDQGLKENRQRFTRKPKRGRRR
jgi:hypothetical protein